MIVHQEYRVSHSRHRPWCDRRIHNATRQIADVAEAGTFFLAQDLQRVQEDERLSTSVFLARLPLKVQLSTEVDDCFAW